MIMACLLMSMRSSSDNFDFPKAWKEVEKLTQDNLPKSVVAKVNEIAKAAEDEDNRPQQIKASSYLASYTLQTEEDGLDQAIVFLQDRIKFSKSEEVASIHRVILADFYVQYLRNNGFRIVSRTASHEEVSEDYKTWSTSTWIDRITEQYSLAIQNPKVLDIPIGEYGDILQKNRKDNIDFNEVGLSQIPTLYILFAEKAIHAFGEIERYQDGGVKDFQITDKKFFAKTYDFLNLEIGDSSLKEKTLKVFQKLLSHTADNREAYVRQNLQRIKTVFNFANYSESRNDYVEALKRLADDQIESPFSTSVLHVLASQQISLDAEEGNLTAIETCKEAIKRFPNSQGAVDCQNLSNRIKKEELSITVEEVYLPNDPIFFRIDFKNVSQVYTKIVKVGSDIMDDMYQRDRNAIKGIIEKEIPISTWSTALPNNGRFTMQSTEGYHEGLSVGSYVIVTSDNAEFNNAYYHALFHVSRLSYTQVMDQSGILKFLVKDRGDSKILQNATLDLYKNQYNSKSRRSENVFLTSIKVDGKGMATYKPNNRNQISVVVKNGNDILNLRKYHNAGGNYNGNVYHTVEFFTDRSIYRPGQVVYFKGIVMQRDANQIPSIAANYPVTLILRDANYQEVETLSLKSNEFGSVSGQFTLPSGGLTGTFTLDAGFGQSSIQVEEYKRPTFEVEIDTMKSNYSMGQTVTLSGSAKTFAGSNIGDAAVSYTVYRKTIYPYWRYYRGYGSPNGNQDLIVQGETITDADGSFRFDVELDAGSTVDRSQKPSFHFVVTVEITDISGETRSNTYTLYAGIAPYILSIDLKDIVEKEDLSRLAISAKNHAQQDAISNGKIEIYKLNAPQKYYRKRYWDKVDTTIISNSEYDNVLSQYGRPESLDPSSWSGDVKVQEYNYSITGEGEIKLDQKLDAGIYRILVKGDDDILLEKNVTVIDFEGEKFPYGKRLYYKLDQKKYQPGDWVTITFGSPDKTVVMYTIESFGKEYGISHFTANSTEELKFIVDDNDRGNIKVHLQYIYDNRVENETIDIPVDWSSKDLKIKYETIRDNMLPGSDQEWKMIISGMDKDQLAAEVLVSMYDSSLDMFSANDWMASWYPNYYEKIHFGNYGYQSLMLRNSNYRWNHIKSGKRPIINYPRLMEFLRMRNAGFGIRSAKRYSEDQIMIRGQAAPAMAEEAEMAMDTDVQFAAMKIGDANALEPAGEDQINNVAKKDKSPSVRKNLNETVFFFPHLKTDKEGSLIFSFKMNEALTSWKVQTLAHTTNLQYGLDSKEVITSQPLMIFPNKPRFLRQGDQIEITAKVANLSKVSQSGNAQIKFFDALTMNEVTDQFIVASNMASFNMAASESDVVSWRCRIPSDLQTAIMYRITAESQDHTDGEENTVALLSNRQLVTETLPMHIKGGEQKSFTMNSLLDKNKTADPFRYTVEVTSHPVWYAVQSLPYLMEYPHECTEQIVNRYYANALASTVANAHPKLKNVFDRWKDSDSDALMSNLNKNQELKSALIDETPWVRAAQSEETQKRNIGLLFDLNRMSNEMNQTWKMLEQRQLGNGGFSWFPGGRDSWYITQYVLEDLGHLRELGIEDFSDNGLITRAVNYIDGELLKQFEIKKDGKGGEYLTHMIVHYMYVRSFYPQVPMKAQVKKALDFYYNQAKSHWNKKSIYLQGMMGLAFFRNDVEKETIEKIRKSLKERSLTNEELGTYWRTDNGFYWHQLPIETHAMLMEFFALVDNDLDFAENTKIWLLKQKQTTNWKTTKATASAIYALLLQKDQKINDWVVESELVETKVGNEILVVESGNVEAGTGYYKKSWLDNQIEPEMGSITLTNPNESVAWGAAYYQYWEQLDKIKSYQDNPLKIDRKIFKVMTDNGEKMEEVKSDGVIVTGDKVRVKLKVVVDRPMEYVHLKDMRASGMEPVDVISRYKWQDGLGYYQSTKDLATHFFISYLPVGTYVLQYDMRASIPGSFSTGIANIQSMYAPEFGAHSEGRLVKINK